MSFEKYALHTLLGQYCEVNIARLQKLLKEFAIDIGYQDLSFEDFHRKTRIMPIEELREKSRLMLLYKFAKKIYPGSEEFLQRREITTGRITRRNEELNNHPLPLELLYQPQKRKEVFENGFLFQVSKNGIRSRFLLVV